jgi:hypothetical protein
MNPSSKKKLVNNMASFLEKIGVKLFIYHTLISFGKFVTLNRLSKIRKNADIFKTNKPKKIVFHCVHSCFVSSIFKEAAIAKTLQLMGHDVTMLICGGKLNNCTGMFNINVPPHKRMCNNCIKFGVRLFSILGLPFVTYGSFINDNISTIEKKGKEYEKHDLFGVNIHNHAETSTARYFKGERLFDENIFSQKFANAIISVTVAKLYNDMFKPDIIVTSHSCYAEWGPFSDYFALQGKKVYTWYTGYNHRSIVFNLSRIDKDYIPYRTTRTPLSNEERKELYDYIRSRSEGIDDTGQYDFAEDASYICNAGKFEKTYVMYPNLPWDVDPTCVGEIFASVYEWVNDTIKIFKETPKHQLIIKIHPAEKLFRSRVGVYEHINKSFPVLPENVFVVGVDDNISPYKLFKYTDVGIIANGTTGLEMVLNDIPVITVGRAHYRGKGFTYDAKTMSEYIHFLFFDENVNAGKVNNKEERDLYSYYYFIKSFIPIPILRHRNFLDIGLHVKEYNDFLNDNKLTHIANCIVNDSLMQRW